MERQRLSRLILLSIAFEELLFFLGGCIGTEYYDVASDEITSPDGVTEVIPQAGTVLTLDIEYKYEFYTRFEPGRDYRVYRYHVLIDGKEYSRGIVNNGNVSASIPIIANDTHSPATVVVEGSKALDYSDYPSYWDTWHELYRSTQEFLPAAESPRYAGLAGARLGMTIDGKTYTFDIQDSGSGEAFKRILKDRSVSLQIYIDNSIGIYPEGEEDARRFWTQIREMVPANCDTEGIIWKAGGIYLEDGNLYVCLKSGKEKSYATLLGFIADSDLKALKSLRPGGNKQVQTSMTLFLTE